MSVSQKCSCKPRRWESVKKKPSKPRRPPIPNCTRPKLGQSVIPRSLRRSHNIKNETSKEHRPGEPLGKLVGKMEKPSNGLDFFAMDFPAVELTPAPLVKPKVPILPKVSSLPEPFSAKLVSEHMKKVKEQPFSSERVPLIITPSAKLQSQHEVGDRNQSIKDVPVREKSLVLQNLTSERLTSQSISNPEQLGAETNKKSPVIPVEDYLEKITLSPVSCKSDGARSDISKITRERKNLEKRNVKVLDFHRVRPRANKLNKPSPKPRECTYSSPQLTRGGIRRPSTSSTSSTSSLISGGQSPITCTEYQVSESSTITPVMVERSEEQERQPTYQQPKFGHYMEEVVNRPELQDPRSYLRFSQSVGGVGLERQLNGVPYGMLRYPESSGLVAPQIMSIPNQYVPTPMMYPVHVGAPLYQGVQLPMYPQPSQPLMPCIQFVQPGAYYHPGALLQQTGFYQPHNINVPQNTDNVIHHNLKYPGV